MMGAARYPLLALALALGASALSPLEGQVPSENAIRERLAQDTSARRRLQSGDTAELRKLAAKALGQPNMTQAQMLDQLRASGYTREQAKQMFASLGMDSAVVDTYYDLAEAQKVEKDQPVVIPGLTKTAVGKDSLVADSLARADSLVMEEPLEVFGRALFARSSSEFQTITSGPVDPEYRIGPGDEIVMLLTGSVEMDHRSTVTSEGYVLVPDVGQVPVNGLTLGELRRRLLPILGSIYEGVGDGSGATAHLHVSLGNLRRSQIYIVGEVESPGAYQVSALTTVFNALYQAGGPTEAGSFRNIQVWRGGRVIQEVDLYDYLLNGDGRSDVRLEHGDRVFVPLAASHVEVRGSIRRPAIYELRAGDSLDEVLRFAGGFGADAFARRVQLDRILPPDQRRPGVDRVLVDVDLVAVAEGEDVPLRAGDVVRVFEISKERRHRLTLTGQVNRPGVYEWTPGSTLRGLIDRAQGLDDEAYMLRAHVYRLNPRDGSRRLIRTPLLADSAGRPMQDLALAESDSVVVYSQESLRNPTAVTIHGYVKNPGTYALAAGMTIQDLIIAAGGFTFGAHQMEAEVARLPDFTARNDTTAQVFRVPLAGQGPTGPEAPGGGGFAFAPAGAHADGTPAWLPSANEFELENADNVFVRKAPGFEQPATVAIAGEVMLPGTYVLETRQEKLTSVLKRAGGITGEAYMPGAQIVRKGEIVATDLEEALSKPSSRYNLVLQPGDSIKVPKRDPTVFVTGDVSFEARVLYEPGKGLDYYIGQAGGYADTADKARVSITYQNGERAVVDKFLLFRFKPDPRPGATIFVPKQPEGAGFDWQGLLSKSVTTLTSIIALRALIDQLQSDSN